MKIFRLVAVATIAIAASACGDLDVVNLNDPDRERAISTPTDVEALISGSFSSWWSSGHYSTIGIAMSTMADSHSSSWGNFAMREMSSEPRVAWNNDPSASNSSQTRNTWRDAYAALSGVRDGLLGFLALGDVRGDRDHVAVGGWLAYQMNVASVRCAVLENRHFLRLIRGDAFSN